MVFIVKVPGINGLGKTKGCEKAGNAILESLKEIYSNEQGKPIDVKLLDLEEIHLDNSNLELSNKLIYENAIKILSDKPKTIFIGGDHSISYSLARAFLDSCKDNSKEPVLIIFDAHADCMPLVKGSESYPTHEAWLRGLIETGFNPKNILLVGIRNLDAREFEFINEKHIRIVHTNQLLNDLDDTCDIMMEFAFSQDKELYLSLDIDVVDPAFAPATGYLEPGGLTSRQFIYLIQRINKMKNLKAVDLVEINPVLDEKHGMITTKLGAKILSELL